MQNLSSVARNEKYSPDELYDEEDTSSAVSWASIMAGVFVIVAFSLTLIGFGTGLGFAVVSPWPREGVSA